MTQRTINLYDDLELLYYMDSDYVDFGSNVISDKSGNGRNGDVVGGVTFNQTGPRNLRTADFGSDGTINLGGDESSVLGIDTGEPNSLFMIGAGSSFGTVKFKQVGYTINIRSSEVDVNLFGNSNVTATVSYGGKFAFLGFTTDGQNNLTAFTQTDSTTVSDGSSTDPIFVEGVNLKIGEVTSNGGGQGGEIGQFWRWSRQLSEAEIESLQRQSAIKQQLL
jgi:hypothetical protein